MTEQKVKVYEYNHVSQSDCKNKSQLEGVGWHQLFFVVELLVTFLCFDLNFDASFFLLICYMSYPKSSNLHPKCMSGSVKISFNHISTY